MNVSTLGRCACGDKWTALTYHGDRAITVVGVKTEAPLEHECGSGHRMEEWMTEDAARKIIRLHYDALIEGRG